MLPARPTLQRSLNMSRIRAKNTKPELFVRSIVHRMGYRFRLHCRNLPGTPDIVLPRRRKVIFVHGCFWHMHNCRKGRSTPHTNAAFWLKKRLANKKRDRITILQLRQSGWAVLVIWECQIKNPQILAVHLQHFLTDRPIDQSTS